MPKSSKQVATNPTLLLKDMNPAILNPALKAVGLTRNDVTCSPDGKVKYMSGAANGQVAVRQNVRVANTGVVKVDHVQLNMGTFSSPEMGTVAITVLDKLTDDVEGKMMDDTLRQIVAKGVQGDLLDTVKHILKNIDQNKTGFEDMKVAKKNQKQNQEQKKQNQEQKMQKMQKKMQKKMQTVSPPFAPAALAPAPAPAMPSVVEERLEMSGEAAGSIAAHNMAATIAAPSDAMVEMD